MTDRHEPPAPPVQPGAAPVLPAEAPVPPGTAPASLAEVRALLAEGRLAAAAALADRLPETPEGIALRARLLTRTGDPAAALALLTPGPDRSLPPGNWARHRAFLLLEAGRPAEAAREFETALAAEPHARDLQLGLVDALELAGDPAAALARVEALLAADPVAPDLQERRDRLAAPAHRRRLAGAAAREAADEARLAPFPTGFGEVFLARFTERFAGREGVHAVGFAAGRDKPGYRPEHAPLTVDLVRRHLAGDTVLGTYLVRRDDTSHLLCFDLDVRRPFVARYAADAEERTRLKRLLMAEGGRLLDQAAAVGLPLLPEFSGFKGLHFWAFADPPVPARHWRVVGNWLLERLGAPPAELAWELFPKQDSVPPDGLGNLVKLPCGVHPQGRRRSAFLAADTFRPAPDQAAAFLAHPVLTPAAFGELLGRLAAQGATVDAPTPPPPAATPGTDLADGGHPVPAGIVPAHPRPDEDPVAVTVRLPLPDRHPPAIERLLAGCPVLWHLADRAAQGGTLSPAEHHVLVYALAVLDEDGRVFLHQLLNQAPGYDPNAVNRAIHAVPPNPIGCAKIRRTLPELAAQAGCACQFRLPEGCYASPLVHAGVLPASDLALPGRGGAHAPCNLSGREEVAGQSGGIDLLMREYRQVAADLGRLARRERLLRIQVNRLFDEAGSDTLVTALGSYARLPTPAPAASEEEEEERKEEAAPARPAGSAA